MVVAVIPNIGFYRRVFVYLLLPLLCDEAPNRGYCIDVPVLWLHVDYGLFVLLAHRLHWLFRVLLVRAEDLQCREGGLGGILTLREYSLCIYFISYAEQSSF